VRRGGAFDLQPNSNKERQQWFEADRAILSHFEQWRTYEQVVDKVRVWWNEDVKDADYMFGLRDDWMLNFAVETPWARESLRCPSGEELYLVLKVVDDEGKHTELKQDYTMGSSAGGKAGCSQVASRKWKRRSLQCAFRPSLREPTENFFLQVEAHCQQLIGRDMK